MSEFAGTIWRWAVIAALVVVGAIAAIAISLDEDEVGPAGLTEPPAARDGAGGALRGCGEIGRLLSAAALLPAGVCRTRGAANVAP